MPERIKPGGERPMKVPEDARAVGFYEGFKFFYKFVSKATYSPRAIGFVYVKSTDPDRVDFVQATAVRRDLIADLTEKEARRGLALDAIRRAKHRVANGAFEIGEVYTIELDQPSVEHLI